MRTFSDESLDMWAEIYLANRFRRLGVSFGQFIQIPEYYTFQFLFAELHERLKENPGWRPLLPAQMKAQLEADFQETLAELQAEQEDELDHIHRVIGPRRQTQSVRMCDGRPIQPLHPRAIAAPRCARSHR